MVGHGWTWLDMVNPLVGHGGRWLDMVGEDPSVVSPQLSSTEGPISNLANMVGGQRVTSIWLGCQGKVMVGGVLEFRAGVASTGKVVHGGTVLPKVDRTAGTQQQKVVELVRDVAVGLMDRAHHLQFATLPFDSTGCMDCTVLALMVPVGKCNLSDPFY